MYDGMITFAIALATSFTVTVPVRQLALHLGMLDRPGPRKVHNTPMPLLGGLGIYCGAVLAIMLSMDGQPRGSAASGHQVDRLAELLVSVSAHFHRARTAAQHVADSEEAVSVGPGRHGAQQHQRARHGLSGLCGYHLAA